MEQRTAAYQTQRDALLAQGYRMQEQTISVLAANLWTFLTAGPVTVAALLAYFIRWKELLLPRGQVQAVLLISMVLIPVHELLHGAFWGMFAQKKWKSIRFGVIWRYLTPYCHCAAPLSAGKYFLGGLAPFFLLGLSTCIFAVCRGVLSALWIGVIHILACGGDITLGLRLIPFRGWLILDHPTQCGFVAFRKPEDMLPR